MDTKTDKEKQKEAKMQIRTMEREVKTAYKKGELESVLKGGKSLLALDPENNLAMKLMRKAEILKARAEAKAKAEKAHEYEVMLKKLLKERDVVKLKDLAAEFVRFMPENKSAGRWAERALKLEAKTESSKPVAPTAKPVVVAAKPVAPAAKPVAPTPAPVLTPLRTSAAAPAPVKPAAPAAPVTPVTKPVVLPSVPAGVAQTAPNGNIFTKMFGKKEEEPPKKSIIDTIVAASAKPEEKKPESAKPSEPQKPAKLKDAAGLVSFARVFMNFTAIFIVLTALFLYVEWIDKENSVLGFVGVTDNTGGRLYRAAGEMKVLEGEEETLNKEIDLYKGGYDDKSFKTVQQIIDNRINWPDVFAKINEVTNSVYELNDFFKYIEYNNYSLDAENGTIRVSGNLSDPLGRNMTKLVELEEAFKYYPKDRNNPDDTTKPYFTGFKEFTSFSKNLNSETGRYMSSFQLSFTLNK